MKRQIAAIAILALASVAVHAPAASAAAGPAPSRSGAPPAGSHPGLLHDTGSWVTRHPLGSAGLLFPFPAGVRYDKGYVDNYGDGRTWSPSGNARRRHEGIDIFAAKGTPVVAVGSGRIVRIGWNQYGGWRLTIELDAAPGYRVYYAHLNGYGRNMYEGRRVHRGEVIGYAGRTGYGPKGHEGDFLPHLHLGIYAPGHQPINPYPFLKLWEQRPKARI